MPQAIDPICGMTVDTEKAIKLELDGRSIYFCSEHCKKKFVEQKNQQKPSCCHHDHSSHEKPSHKPQQASSSKEIIYTCPMHQEIRQNGPGSCPKCGMALEPLA